MYLTVSTILTLLIYELLSFYSVFTQYELWNFNIIEIISMKFCDLTENRDEVATFTPLESSHVMPGDAHFHFFNPFLQFLFPVST